MPEGVGINGNQLRKGGKMGIGRLVENQQCGATGVRAVVEKEEAGGSRKKGKAKLNERRNSIRAPKIEEITSWEITVKIVPGAGKKGVHEHKKGPSNRVGAHIMVCGSVTAKAKDRFRATRRPRSRERKPD